MKAIRRLAVLAAVILSAAGCWRGGDSDLRLPGGTPIILISVDTLRSDRLPAYGYPGVETPAIDRLRQDGILFERAYTHVPLTLPAHTSLLSGLLPPDHGVRDNLGYTFDATHSPLLQQVLKEAGYATGAGVSAYALRRATGVATGFDVYDKALIVFLSDHGEDLGDHGEGEHGVFLYRSTLQVPLIIKLPLAEGAAETVADPVQLIDVYPTLLSALGLPYGEEIRGMPLLARSRPSPQDNLIYAETFFPRLHFGWSDLAALIVGSHHFIDAPRPELYDLVQDPDEIDNLLAAEPGLANAYRTTLGQYDRHLEEPEAVDAETRRRLEALGYVGGASTTEDDVLPDPKDRVHWMADIQRAYRLYHDGDLESAVPAFQRILDANPNIEDVWGYLALSQLELGRSADAMATFEAALEQLPESRRLSLRAARLLEAMGRLDEAAVHASRAMPYDPSAAHLLLAQIALKKGDLVGAETEAREAMSSGDRSPGSRLILADVFLSRGQPRQAIDLLTRTLEEGITEDPVYAKLAVTYAWIGEFDRTREILNGFEEINDPGLLLTFGRLALSRQLWGEARDWFERVLVVDPANATAKLNLGLIAMNEGRLTDARRLLQEAVAADLGSFEGWSAPGMVFARQGDPEGAIMAWQRARQINPGIVDILFNLGLAHAQLGHLSRAIGYFEDYVASAPPGPKQEQAVAMVQRLRASQNH